MVMVLMRTLSDGPDVSLKGSPTVSPVTVAACMLWYFLARRWKSSFSPASPRKRPACSLVSMLSMPNSRTISRKSGRFFSSSLSLTP